MFERTVSPNDLARLKQEREEADVAYNEALTALDASIQQLRQMPDPPLPVDEHQVKPLNEGWDLQTLQSGQSGWRGRVRSVVWWVAAPLVSRQQTFNSAVVDHVNRTVVTHRDLVRAVQNSLAVLRDELTNLVRFQARLIEYAQQLTPYIDTKDRETIGLMHRINEDVAEVTNGLAGGLSGVGDELQKRWESLVARERRYEAQLDEVHSTSAVWHQVTQSLKRELEQLQQLQPRPPYSGDDAPATTMPQAPSEAASAFDNYKYVVFEDKFRGSANEIRTRVATYLPYFEGAENVLDAGCGRGEFLELLRDQGVSASGVDVNHDMVELCRARGLAVEEGDILTHLLGLADASVGGLFAAQVVEHLEPAYLLRLLDTAFLKLSPGAKLVLETINVASWSAFFQSYVRDITHVRPLHPDTLKYFVTASGFQKVEILYRSPIPPENRLEPVPRLRSGAGQQAPPPDGSAVDVLNRNIDKLNQLLFADQDYSVVGERP